MRRMESGREDPRSVTRFRSCTFAVGIFFFQAEDGIRDKLVTGVQTCALPILRELGTDISRVLHGEQEFEIHRPLQPGQTYLCRATVVDVYEKSGKSGPMAFVVRETAITDRDNELVATMRAVTVVRL